MTEYKPNRAGLQEMLRSQGVRLALLAKARKVKFRAEAIAPVQTGRYRASFTLEWGEQDGRVFARVLNRTPYARFLEFGTRYMRKQRILGRALDAARD